MQASTTADTPTQDDPANDFIILSVPVLATPRPPVQSSGEDGSIAKDSRRRFSLFKRKPSTNKENKDNGNDISKHVTKDMTRTEYLKHYALDGYGRYIGTEDPAPDCILKDARDIAKYKMPPEYRVMLGDTASLQLNSPLMAGASVGMGMGMGAAAGSGF